MSKTQTVREYEAELGQQVRALRLRQNHDQRALAERAGVALTALKNLESGKGATLKTLIKTLRALERAGWLETLAPAVSVSPLQLLKSKPARRRVSPRAVTKKLENV